MNDWDDEPVGEEPAIHPDWEALAEQQRQEREAVLAGAVRLCLKQDNIPLALALLDSEVVGFEYHQDGGRTVNLETSADAYEVIEQHNVYARNDEPPYLPSMWSRLSLLFDPLMGHGRHCASVSVRIRMERASDDWRETVKAALEGEGNQGRLGEEAGFEARFRHNGLRFRSHSEVVLAQELDRRGILYFPLPAAVRGGFKLEPDFLIIHKGRAGIIEVHGEPYHPATRAADDHQRNRFFKDAGVFVEVFDAQQVREHAQQVVAKFLQLMAAIHQ